MALKSKTTKEEIPFEVETKAEQISFDDLEFEAEYVDEDELNGGQTYYTVSGKESVYEPTW